MRDLTIRDISQRLGVAWLTVYNWITKHEPPLPAEAKQHGERAVRYHAKPKQVENWLSENRPDMFKQWRKWHKTRAKLKPRRNKPATPRKETPPISRAELSAVELAQL